MTEIITIDDELITHKIYFIRGHKVMLDSDLAELYQVETRVLNQAVNRNQERFPSDFSFTLTTEEWSSLISQFVISKTGRGGRRKLPVVFTEFGILMISSVLNSPIAIQVNIQIVRIFARIRHMIADHAEIRLEIEKIKKEVSNQGKNMEVVFQYLDELSNKIDHAKPDPTPRKRIGYKSDDW